MNHPGLFQPLREDISAECFSNFTHVPIIYVSLYVHSTVNTCIFEAR